MTAVSPQSTKKRLRTWLIISVTGILAFVAFFFVYLNLAFPKTRSDAIKHLEIPDTVSDCYECHIKATPKLAQDWYESKHGVILIKCFVCHGQPDGKGSVPFAVNPDVNTTCGKCHDSSIQKMVGKYGLNLDCNECHPFHHNSLHHQAYVKPIAKK